MPSLTRSRKTERDAAVCRRIAAGERVALVAADFDVTPHLIRFIAAAELAQRTADKMARNGEILARLRSGESVASIAASVNLSPWGVYAACRRAGALVSDLPGHMGHRRRPNPERNRRIADAILGGAKPLSVAAAHGLSVAQVNVIARRHGVNLAACRRRRDEADAARRMATGLSQTDPDAYLDAAVARECAPAWERHPVPWDLP